MCFVFHKMAILKCRTGRLLKTPSTKERAWLATFNPKIEQIDTVLDLGIVPLEGDTLKGHFLF